MKTVRIEQPRLSAIMKFIRDRFHAGVFALALAVGLLTLFAAPARCAELHSDVMSMLRKATFEVVLRKPTGDTLTYEKPLPLDLLPYQQRTDKYQAIGTAFAVDSGLVVSAAHVFDLETPSVRDRIFLRDSDGNVMAINEWRGNEFRGD